MDKTPVARVRSVAARTMLIPAFWTAFTVTVLCLLVALISGWRGRRRMHLVFGPATMVAMVVAILLALRLGEVREFPETIMGVHRVFAVAGSLLAVPVIVTGVMLLGKPRMRLAHRLCVGLFSLCLVAATATGVWAFLGSSPG